MQYENFKKISEEEHLTQYKTWKHHPTRKPISLRQIKFISLLLSLMTLGYVFLDLHNTNQNTLVIDDPRHTYK